jgi:putative membrane protein
MRADPRWPGWVYGTGEEPDYRVSFANERTLLAWLRTSLALIAGGVALDALDLPMSDALQRPMAFLLVLLALVCAVASWFRWARAERAMRRGAPLPSSPMGAVLVVGVVVCGALLLVATR